MIIFVGDGHTLNVAAWTTTDKFSECVWTVDVGHHGPHRAVVQVLKHMYQDGLHLIIASKDGKYVVKNTEVAPFKPGFGGHIEQAVLLLFETYPNLINTPFNTYNNLTPTPPPPPGALGQAGSVWSNSTLGPTTEQVNTMYNQAAGSGFPWIMTKIKKQETGNIIDNAPQ